MGKEKTKSDSIGHNSNDANKTIEENKENSLKDKNSVSSGKSSKKSSKLSSKIFEVLEDEITSDSTTSSDTKASTSSSNTTNNSSSTSTSKTNSSAKVKTPVKTNKKKSSKSDKKDKEGDENEQADKKSSKSNKKDKKEDEEEKVDKKSSKSNKKDKRDKEDKKSSKSNRRDNQEEKEDEEEGDEEEKEEDEVEKEEDEEEKEEEEEEEDTEKVVNITSKSDKTDKDESIEEDTQKTQDKNEEEEDIQEEEEVDEADKVDNITSKSGKADKDEDTQKTKDKDEEEVENSKTKEEPQFRVAPSSNSTGFKLRIVPLEKLLEKPPKEQESKKEEKKSSQSLVKRGRDKSSDRSAKNQPIRARDKSSDRSSNNQPIRRLPGRSRKPTSFVELSDSSTDDDDIISVKYSDSSEDAPKKAATKRKSATKQKSEDIESINSSESSEDVLPIKTAVKRKAATKEKVEVKESSVSSDDVPIKTAAKRKSATTQKSVDIESIKSSESSEDVPIKSVAKRQAATKEKSEDIDSIKSSESSDEIRPIKPAAKRQAKTKSRPRPPPSPSSIKRCVVKLKRSKLSDFKNLKSSTSNNKKSKMNGKTEKPSTSTSRRKRVSSDDDSDFDVKRVGDGSDNDRVSANDDDDSLDSSDSEVIPTRKRRVFQKNKNSDNSDDDFEPESKQKTKRRRIKKNTSDESDDEDEKKEKTKRKDIRKIIKTSDLNVSTKTATKEEEERRKRIEERQKLYNEIYEKPDSVEVNELVLDFDPETKKTLLEVDKGLMKKLKPHQVTGVKFMWDACFETIEDAKEKPGSGCILAHCMGLGKTMQICTLSHTLLTNSNKTGVERVLIISPLSTLNNWAREFKQWIGFTRKRNIEIYDMSKYKDKNTRIFKLNEWYEEGGVCIMGYDMYRILTNEKAKGLRKKQREHLHQSLVDPGPDMVVCDEGHLLKNEKTSISKAVTRMRTLRRIVLTGTPLQNNLKEYYCMIQFIKPNLLGTYKEYLNRFVNPITNGQYADSTERDMRLMKHRSHILHQLLQGCIQRRDYSVLAPYLPPKHEYVVYTTLSTVQQYIYEHYMTHQRDVGNSMSEGKGARLFQDFQELRRIWTHPMNMRINSDSVIRKKVLANETDSMEDFIDDDNDDEDDAVSSDSSDNSSKSFASGGGAAPKKAVKTRNFRRNAAEKGEEIDSDIEEVKPMDQDDPSEWWKRFVSDKELNNINHSPKLVILMKLLEQCEKIGDKLLVFSQSLQSLDTIEHFLSLIDSKTRGYEYEGDVGDFKGFWNPGTDYFRLDGSCSVEQRETMCRKFNDCTNLRARLFLISTRAGGLGINLVSANRVVIFDVSWNPSHDTQSIFRVYRFGQTKPCYIYRLIAMGTMEQKLYERQVAKQATAKRVIDEQQISRHYNQSDLQELYTYELKPGVPREIPILPKDRLFAELLSQHEDLLFKYHEHDSLLENEESENLSEAERKEAWSEFEAEKTRAVQTTQFMAYDRGAFGNQFGNAAGSVTSNKIFGFRSDVLLQLLNMKIAKDHPEMSQNQVIQVVPAYLNELYSQMNNGDPTMYKDLLTLHATLTHPSGMYMSPLLYVNQNPGAAGYYQNNQMANGSGMVANPLAQVPIAAKPAPGFDPNEVYEID